MQKYPTLTKEDKPKKIKHLPRPPMAYLHDQAKRAARMDPMKRIGIELEIAGHLEKVYEEVS